MRVVPAAILFLVAAGAHSAAAEKTGPRGNPADHWAYRPLRKPPLPEPKRQDWVRNPVDLFILARLESEGFEPSPEADPVTLLRRSSLDLVGLPPSPADVEEFLSDTRPDAYERWIDRLLASPHHG